MRNIVISVPNDEQRETQQEILELLRDTGYTVTCHVPDSTYSTVRRTGKLVDVRPDGTFCIRTDPTGELGTTPFTYVVIDPDDIDTIHLQRRP